MKYVLHMIDNNGNRQLELLDTTTDPMAEIEKNLNNRTDLADFSFFIPKEQYDYEVRELKKVQECKTHCKVIIEDAKEIKALLDYDDDRIIELNYTRLMADIEQIKNSISKIELIYKNANKT